MLEKVLTFAHLITGTDRCDYKCTSNERCISNDAICNTIPDCPNGEDERQNCGKLSNYIYIYIVIIIYYIYIYCNYYILYKYIFLIFFNFQISYPMEVIAPLTVETCVNGSTLTMPIQVVNGSIWKRIQTPDILESHSKVFTVSEQSLI